MRTLNTQQRWLIVAGAAGLVASQVAKRAMNRSWRKTASNAPPEDPRYGHVGWPKAIAWTAAAGAVVALAELLGRQVAAGAWKRVTGKRPPRARRR